MCLVTDFLLFLSRLWSHKVYIYISRNSRKQKYSHSSATIHRREFLRRQAKDPSNIRLHVSGDKQKVMFPKVYRYLKIYRFCYIWDSIFTQTLIHYISCVYLNSSITIAENAWQIPCHTCCMSSTFPGIPFFLFFPRM